MIWNLLQSDPTTLGFLCFFGGPASAFVILMYLSGKRKQSGDASHLSENIPPILGISPTRSRKS